MVRKLQNLPIKLIIFCILVVSFLLFFSSIVKAVEYTIPGNACRDPSDTVISRDPALGTITCDDGTPAGSSKYTIPGNACRDPSDTVIRRDPALGTITCASAGSTGSSGGGGGGVVDLGIIKIKPLDPGTVVRNLVIVAFFAAGLFFFAQLLVGGISWINAGGDPKAMDAARSRITNAVIGMVIVAASFAIALIVTMAFGINIFQPGGVSLPP